MVDGGVGQDLTNHEMVHLVVHHQLREILVHFSYAFKMSTVNVEGSTIRKLGSHPLRGLESDALQWICML